MKYQIIIDPTAQGSVELARQLSTVGDVDMPTANQIIVQGTDNAVHHITDEFPQVVMKVEQCHERHHRS